MFAFKKTNFCIFLILFSIKIEVTKNSRKYLHKIQFFQNVCENARCQGICKALGPNWMVLIISRLSFGLKLCRFENY